MTIKHGSLLSIFIFFACLGLTIVGFKNPAPRFKTGDKVRFVKAKEFIGVVIGRKYVSTDEGEWERKSWTYQVKIDTTTYQPMEFEIENISEKES